MKTSIHVIGDRAQYEYAPDPGKVLARTWRSPYGRPFEACFHCDQSGKADGKLETEIPHDADRCDLCGAKAMP